MSLHEPEFREITDADLASVAELLMRGFPGRKRAFWLSALGQLIKHQRPPGLPRYGYIIRQQGRPVGVILTIFSQMRDGERSVIRCNPCAWYVDPPFRAYAGLLLAKALSHKNVTYLNVTPSLSTRPMIEALGFSRYCDGTFMAVPLFNIFSGRAEAKVFSPYRRLPIEVDRFEKDLLVQHAEHGCISVWCVSERRAHPFVFQRRLAKGFMPCARLIYCRAVEDFVRFAGPIGRYLARRGCFIVMLGANAPLTGLVGKFRSDILPRYFKGAQCPNLADVAYTEFGVLGV
jgi:hypothetical protein